MTRSTHHQGAVFLQLRVGGRFRFGPGKAALLRAIAEAGSISAASRRLGMSYRRAWSLVSEMNAAFVEPVVLTRLGGSPEGAATLSELGQQLVRRYAELERQVGDCADDFLQFMTLRTSPPQDAGAG